MGHRAIFWLVALFFLSHLDLASESTISAASTSDEIKKPRSWTLDLGVAVISDNTTFGILRNDVNDADGDEGGQIYHLTLSYTLAEMNWTIGGMAYHPRLELPLSVGIVNENGRSPFPLYHGALTFRWTDFPWNSFLGTTIGIGGGLWYSGKVLAIDRKRHQNEDRSHLKFFLPLDLTLSLPAYKQYQLVFFNHHASGGHVFDEGGIDVWGTALRYRF